jgi:hypothetical protein
MRKTDKGIEIEQIIIGLQSNPKPNPVLSDVQSVRARVATKLRGKATHAQWDEVDSSDVQETIKFTREFIAANMKK